MRLDQYISKEYGISRSLASNYIRSGFVMVDNLICPNPSKTINKSNIIQLRRKPPKITILYENDHFLMVHKPNNLSVCRTFNTPKYEFVLNESVGIKDLYIPTKKHEFGLVHRLDKETEGLMIMVKSELAYETLYSLFHNRKVYKFYYSYEREMPELNFQHFICSHNRLYFSYLNQCVCDINYDENHQLPMIRRKDRVYVHSEGTPTVTKIKKYDGYLLINLITGFTHQIRLTMHHLGQPIIGDNIYGSGGQKLHLCSVGIAFSMENMVDIY